MWGHLCELKSYADAGYVALQHGDGAEGFGRDLDADAPHGLEGEILGAADERTRLAQVDEIARNVDTGPHKADRNLAD